MEGASPRYAAPVRHEANLQVLESNLVKTSGGP